MDTEKRATRKLPPGRASLIEAAWVNLVVIVLAALCVGFGLYLRARPDWAKRADIREYNLGRSAYNDMPTTRGASTSEKASAHFEKAIVQTRDPEIKALALCNVGTMNGKLAFDAVRSIKQTYAVRRLKGVENDENLLMARQEIRKAIQRLAEAIRLDPTLADAKFNLELLETERGEGEVRGSRFSPGQVDKGY
jgi:tetratricopeptide (TPR) repeat protein